MATETEQEQFTPIRLKFLKRHGIPHKPCSVAHDPVQGLMALAGGEGEIQIMGKVGVEVSLLQPGSLPVSQVFFSSNEGILFSLCESDNSVTKWDFRVFPPEQVGRFLLTEEEVTMVSASKPGDRMILSYLPVGGRWIFIGTEGGNVFLLDKDSLQLSEYNVTYEKISTRARGKWEAPGFIMGLEESPVDASFLLILVSGGWINLWNLRSNSCEVQFFPPSSDAITIGASWHYTGKQLVAGYSDGFICIWQLDSPHKPSRTISPSDLYGVSANASITRIFWLANPNSKDGLILFSGGTVGSESLLTIIYSHSSKMHSSSLVAPSVITDFTPISFHPHRDKAQYPHAVAILCREELMLYQIMDYFAWQELPVPTANNLATSLVTAVDFIDECPIELLDTLQVLGQSSCYNNMSGTHTWPLNGGSRDPGKESSMIITGHENGDVRFWNSSRNIIELIYYIKSAPLFKHHTAKIPPPKPSPPKRTQSTPSSSSNSTEDTPKEDTCTPKPPLPKGTNSTPSPSTEETPKQDTRAPRPPLPKGIHSTPSPSTEETPKQDTRTPRPPPLKGTHSTPSPSTEETPKQDTRAPEPSPLKGTHFTPSSPTKTPKQDARAPKLSGTPRDSSDSKCDAAKSVSRNICEQNWGSFVVVENKEGERDRELAISYLKLCPISRVLCVANRSGFVIVYKLLSVVEQQGELIEIGLGVFKPPSLLFNSNFQVKPGFSPHLVLHCRETPTQVGFEPDCHMLFLQLMTSVHFLSLETNCVYSQLPLGQVTEVKRSFFEDRNKRKGLIKTLAEMKDGLNSFVETLSSDKLSSFCLHKSHNSNNYKFFLGTRNGHLVCVPAVLDTTLNLAPSLSNPELVSFDFWDATKRKFECGPVLSIHCLATGVPPAPGKQDSGVEEYVVVVCSHLVRVSRVSGMDRKKMRNSPIARQFGKDGIRASFLLKLDSQYSIACLLESGTFVIMSLPSLVTVTEELKAFNCWVSTDTFSLKENGNGVFLPTPSSIQRMYVGREEMSSSVSLYNDRETPEMHTNSSFFSRGKTLGVTRGEVNEVLSAQSERYKYRQEQKSRAEKRAEKKDVVARAREGLDERGEKLNIVADRAADMSSMAEQYLKNTRALAQKNK